MDARRRRLFQSLAVVAAAGVVAYASFTAAVVFSVVRCGGDGGVPYSAGDSPAGRLCEDATSWAYLALAFPTVLVLVVGAIGVARARWLWVAVAGVPGLGLAVALFVFLISLPTECAREDQRLYEIWVEGGRFGEQPADCQTY